MRIWLWSLACNSELLTFSEKWFSFIEQNVILKRSSHLLVLISLSGQTVCLISEICICGLRMRQIHFLWQTGHLFLLPLSPPPPPPPHSSFLFLFSNNVFQLSPHLSPGRISQMTFNKASASHYHGIEWVSEFWTLQFVQLQLVSCIIGAPEINDDQ